jgi:hypothetical protein
MDAEYIRGSNGDGEAVRAIVTTDRGIGDSDLIVDSVLNWPNKFIATVGDLDEGTGLFDPDTISIFYGTLTGSIITIDQFAPGYSDVGNEINQSVVLKPTTAWADTVADNAGGAGSGIIVSPTPPPDPEEDDFWLDESEEGDAGFIAFSAGQAVSGLVNSSNTVYTVAYGSYIAGSLQVFVNGLAQTRTTHFVETNPTTGTFTMTSAPVTGDIIQVNYQNSPASANNADTIDGYQLSAIVDAFYPVGSVFVSGSGTMPALIASIGTWVRLEGRVIVGLDAAQTEFDTINETGGAKTHTLTVAEMPNHQHDLEIQFGSAAGGTYQGLDRVGGASNLKKTTFTGGGGAHNNLQPYKVKYMWERTA